MASGTLQSAGIARRATWAARLVVLAAFFDLFVQFPTIAPHAEQLGASAALVGFIVAAYSFTNLFGNLGAGFILDRWERRTPLVHRHGDNHPRRPELLRSPDPGPDDRRKGGSRHWRCRARAGRILDHRRQGRLRQVGAGNGPHRSPNSRRGADRPSRRRHPEGCVERRRGLHRRRRIPPHDPGSLPSHHPRRLHDRSRFQGCAESRRHGTYRGETPASGPRTAPHSPSPWA